MSCRSKIKFILHVLAAISGVTGRTTKFGEKFTWDDSQADRADYYPASTLIWPRLDSSPFLLYKGNAGDLRLPIIKRSPVSKIMDLPRKRRNTAEPNYDNMETSKNTREMRMNDPGMWFKQPLSQRPRQYPVAPERVHTHIFDDNAEISNYSIQNKSPYAAKTDFVTSGRNRDNTEVHYYPEARRSRDNADYVMNDYEPQPMFRNIGHERDFDVPISRNYYSNRPSPAQPSYNRGYGRFAYPSYPYDRYQADKENYDLGARYRSFKPKRIIYYAHLPDISKPSWSSYPRPLDPYRRTFEDDLERPNAPAMFNPPRRPPPVYNNYDNYIKRASLYDRRRPYYPTDVEGRVREPDKIRENYVDKIRGNERKLDNQIVQSGEMYRVPWPIRVGAELTVKDDERIPGRKIFNQMEGYNNGLRVKKTSEVIERKEDESDENEQSSNNSNTSNNN